MGNKQRFSERLGFLKQNIFSMYEVSLVKNYLRIFITELTSFQEILTDFLNIVFLRCLSSRIFKPFVPNASFLYSQKTLENLMVKTLWFSDVSMGVEKGCIRNEWVNDTYREKLQEQFSRPFPNSNLMISIKNSE